VSPGDLLFVLVPVAFLFLLFNGQRKRQRQAAQLQEQITVGSTICMTSGLFGRVVSLTEAEVVIEAAPGVNLRYDRRAVGLVVPSPETQSPAGTDLSDEPDGHDGPT
jgi:preprotein translocase subunit YajC